MEEKKENFLDKKIELPKINIKKIFPMLQKISDISSQDYNPVFMTVLRILPVVAVFMSFFIILYSKTIFSFLFGLLLLVLNILGSTPLIIEIHEYHLNIKREKARKEELERLNSNADKMRIKSRKRPL